MTISHFSHKYWMQKWRLGYCNEERLQTIIKKKKKDNASMTVTITIGSNGDMWATSCNARITQVVMERKKFFIIMLA